MQLGPISSFLFSLLLGITSLFASAKETNIVFIHIGRELPPYVETAVDQAQLFNQNAQIYLLGNLSAVCSVAHKYRHTNVEIVPIEGIPTSKEHKKFRKSSKLSRQFRNGHNSHASERFFYLADFAMKEKIEDIFHLENDVMLYVDLSTLLPQFKALYESIATTFDNEERCVPGFIYFRNPAALSHLTSYLQKQAANDRNDMEAISNYRHTYGTSRIDALPILASDYEKTHPLISLVGHRTTDPSFYQKNVHFFNSIFDAAALGQYLGGVDPRNGSMGPGYVNEECLFNPRHFSYVWKPDHKNRLVPYLHFAGIDYRINNLHIHSKALSKFSSRSEALASQPMPH